MTAAPQSFQQRAETLRHAPLPWRLAGKGTIRGAGNDSWVCSLHWRDRDGNAALLVEAINGHEALKARVADLEANSRFLLDRLQEFDPGDFESERDFHGHVAPAIARLRNALGVA